MKMIKASLLTKEERQWVKDHNAMVRKSLEPLLLELNDKTALKYLRRECGKGFGSEGMSGAGISIEWD